jgi:hypothetical protein
VPLCAHCSEEEGTRDAYRVGRMTERDLDIHVSSSAYDMHVSSSSYGMTGERFVFLIGKSHAGNTKDSAKYTICMYPPPHMA